MSYDIEWVAHSCRVRSADAAGEAESAERILRDIEDEIFALICMSPGEARANASADCDDGGCEDNARYLMRRWADLKESWRETFSRAELCQSIAQAAAEKDPFTVGLCPDCMRQVRWEYEKGTFDAIWKCPKCGKTVEKPLMAEIDHIIMEG